MRLDCNPFKFSLASVVSALILVGMLFVSSCQTSTGSNPAPGPETRTRSFIDSMYTTLVTWSRGTDTGSIKFEAGALGMEKQIEIELQSPLNDGSVQLELWSLGIRTTRYVMKSYQSSSLAPDSIQRDTLARRLISLLRRRSGSDTAVKFTPEGLIKLYAQELVERTSDSLLGFPVRRPVGIDSAKVVDAALVYLATKKSLQAQASFFGLMNDKLFLGVDTSKIHVRILALIELDLIGSADSLRLFPLPPVRVKTPISVEPDSLVATGPKLGVKGVFAADANRGVAYVEVKILDSASVDRSAWFDVISSSPSGQAEWDLNQKLSIRTDSLEPGTYRLVVTVRDKDRKDSATSSTSFRVVLPPPPPPKADATGPTIVLDGSTPSTVEGVVESTTVRVKVTDESGIAKVAIADGDAAESEGSWSRKVELPAYGRNEIVVKATDKKGNVSTLPVYIVRKIPGDAKGPTVKIAGDGASEVKLPFEQGSVRLQWTVTDPDGLKRVEIGGAVRASTSDTFSIEVAVAPDAEPVEIRLFAINTKLIGSESVIRVVRAKDSVKPVVKIDSASWVAAGAFQGDTLVVPTATTSFDLGLKITDNHKIASVIVAGESLKVADDGLYHWKNSSVATGINNATFIVTDSTGLISYFYGKVLRRDQVVVTATSDADPFQDVGVVKATTTTPGAVVEYSTDGATWKAVPEGGIEIRSSVNISFRGRKDGFNDGVLERRYVVKITPPPEAVPLVWNEGNWYDGANTAAISIWQ